MLPVGAANIDIRQRGYKGMMSDDNYLAVKNSDGHYLLNGNYVVSAGERDILVKGSLLRYSGTTGLSETLHAVKPLEESLTVEVLCAGKMTPPRIRYSFYLARQKEDKIQKKEEHVNSHNSVLAEDSVKEKEEDLKKSYSKEDSTVGKWVSTGWEECSVTCGHGLQQRLVQCLRPDGKPGLGCDPLQMPSTTRVCGDPCPEWYIGQWSPCSRTCGKGFKRRPLQCKTDTGHLLPRDHCTGLRKPQELDFCNQKPCYWLKPINCTCVKWTELNPSKYPTMAVRCRFFHLQDRTVGGWWTLSWKKKKNVGRKVSAGRCFHCHHSDFRRYYPGVTLKAKKKYRGSKKI